MKQESITGYREKNSMQIFQAEKRVSRIGGWIGKSFIALMTFTGGCNKDVFNGWLFTRANVIVAVTA